MPIPDRYGEGMSKYLGCVVRQARLYLFYSSATFTFLPYCTYCLVLFYGAQVTRLIIPTIPTIPAIPTIPTIPTTLTTLTTSTILTTLTTSTILTTLTTLTIHTAAHS